MDLLRSIRGIDALSARVGYLERPQRDLEPIRRDVAALVERLSAFTREVVAVRRGCGEALAFARDSASSSAASLQRAEAVAEQIAEEGR